MGRDDKALEPMFFAVTQPDYLDGELIYVGDEDRTVSIHIREDEIIHKCTTDIAIANQLRTFVDGPPLRVFGTADWVRHETDGWQLHTFGVENFMPLENKTLRQALSHFEELPSPNWPRNFGSKE